jgi:hypothetical protein
LLVGGYSGLVAFHALQQQPLRIPLRWSLFFVSINLSMVVKLILDEWEPTLSDEEEAMHVASFASLSRQQFKKLLDTGERVTFPAGTNLTEESVSCREAAPPASTCTLSLPLLPPRHEPWSCRVRCDAP